MTLIKEEKMSSEAPMYIYASEMVGPYYSKLNLSNKKVLSICGSGDQILNSYFLGAKRVLGFDLNKRSEFITRLKIAAISTLNYLEFLKFFGSINVNVGFNYELYLKIRKNLDNKTKSFFDELYKKYSNDGLKLVKSSYFRQRGDFFAQVKTMNLYLKNEQEYLKLRELLKEVKFEFIQCDIVKLYKNNKVKKESWDIINLSNVPNYLVSFLIRQNKKKPMEYFFKDILLNLRKILSVKGKIFFVSYSENLYPNRIAKEKPLATSKQTVRWLKNQKGFTLKLIRFKGIKKNTFDQIVVLEKN